MPGERSGARGHRTAATAAKNGMSGSRAVGLALISSRKNGRDTRDQPGEGRHRVDEPVGEQSSEVVESNHCGLRELRPERERRVRNLDTRVPLDNDAHRDGRGLVVAAEAVQDG